MVSVVGGLVGLLPSVRRAVGRFRPVADPAHRRGMVAAAIIASARPSRSTVLAGARRACSASSSASRAGPSDGLELTALALGAALLGGTSAFGRRGGIFGTVFAVGAADRRHGLRGRDRPDLAGGRRFAAVAIGVGLVVTRLVERFGRPVVGEPTAEDEDWAPQVHAASRPAGAHLAARADRDPAAPAGSGPPTTPGAAIERR